MRWGLAFRALCMSAAVAAPACDRATGQEIEDGDFNVLPSSSSSSFWSSLFDTRISKRRAFDFLSGGMPDRMMYFGGMDASKWSLGAHLGAQWAPAGFDRDGVILRFFWSENLERFTTDARLPAQYTQVSRVALLPGYMFRAGKVDVQLMAGVEYQGDYRVSNWPRASARGQFGMRAVADIWWEPTRELMVQYALTGTTNDNGYTTRIAAGWRLFDAFWIGPEATLSRDYFSKQTRVGGHLTGLRTGSYEWSFAAGFVHDNFQREGLYARFGIMLKPPRAPFFEN
jgi:hypothetical protein